MSTPNTGGPAFPRAGFELSYEHSGTYDTSPQDGMSLRDYFAAHAPPMDDDWASFRRTEPPPEEVPEEELRLRAEWAYAYADALLARRAGKGGAG